MMIAATILALAATPVAVNERLATRDCTADVMAYCRAELQLGRNAVVACLVANRAKLRPVCARHLSEMGK